MEYLGNTRLTRRTLQKLALVLPAPLISEKTPAGIPVGFS